MTTQYPYNVEDDASTVSVSTDDASIVSVSTDDASTPGPSGSGAAQNTAAATSSKTPDRSKPISDAMSNNYKKLKGIKRWGKGTYKCEYDGSDKGEIRLTRDDFTAGTIENRDQITMKDKSLKGTGPWKSNTVDVVLSMEKEGSGGKEEIDLYNRR